MKIAFKCKVWLQESLASLCRENTIGAKVSQTLCISATAAYTTVYSLQRTCQNHTESMHCNERETLCFTLREELYNVCKVYLDKNLLAQWNCRPLYVYCVPEANIEKCIVAARYIFIFSPPASSSFPCRRNVSCGIKGGFYLFSGRPSLCCALNRARLRWWSPLRLMLTCKIFERTTFTYFHAHKYMHCQKNIF